MEEEQVRGHLSKLDIYKSISPDGMNTYKLAEVLKYARWPRIWSINQEWVFCSNGNVEKVKRHIIVKIKNSHNISSFIYSLFYILPSSSPLMKESKEYNYYLSSGCKLPLQTCWASTRNVAVHTGRVLKCVGETVTSSSLRIIMF